LEGEVSDKCLGDVFAREYRRLVRVAGAVVGRDAAADVVQTAYLNVLSSGCGEVRDLAAWLTTAVQNAAIDAVRSETTSYDHTLQYLQSNPVRCVEEDDLSLRVDVQRALDRISSPLLRRTAEAVLLRGETEREVVAREGVSTATVHALVVKARDILRAALAEHAPAPSQTLEGKRGQAC
jgi:RNA polymerase sigma factor (sigma-70 family)